jgi:hypothetical protein
MQWLPLDARSLRTFCALCAPCALLPRPLARRGLGAFSMSADCPTVRRSLIGALSLHAIVHVCLITRAHTRFLRQRAHSNSITSPQRPQAHAALCSTLFCTCTRDPKYGFIHEEHGARVRYRDLHLAERTSVFHMARLAYNNYQCIIQPGARRTHSLYRIERRLLCTVFINSVLPFSVLCTLTGLISARLFAQRVQPLHR